MLNPAPSVADHWESVYEKKPADGMSWYRPHLDRSLAIIDSLRLPSDAHVVDVGAGASTLVDDLLERGFGSITVLDLSARALDASKRRLGARAAQVRWVAGDMLTARLDPSSVDLWHDRAVLHFLTDERDRARYAAQLRTALRPGSHALIAGFAPDGPTRCSDLPVRRAAPEELAALLGPEFRLLLSDREIHRTPWGAEQRFSYCLCRRDG